MVDPATWKYGPAFDPPANAKIWNPVKLKMMQRREGDRRHGVQRHRSAKPTAPWPMPATTSSGPRCSTTRATGKPSRACGAPVPTPRRCRACASPIPTSARSSMRSMPARWSSWCRRSRSVRGRQGGRDWTYFPPLGKRSNGGGQAFDAAMWGGVPGGYRNTINDNSC